jgi:predicted Zn-dependent protease
LTGKNEIEPASAAIPPGAYMPCAIERDPLTSINLTMYGMVAMFDGNYPEALTWTQRSVDIDPANPTPRMMHALMLAANGRREEGVAMLDAVAGDTSAMAWARLAPAMACALRGERRAAACHDPRAARRGGVG